MFSEVAREVGLHFVHDRGAFGRKHYPETMGAGLAWLDFDGDGMLDLYLVQSGPFPPDGSGAAANRLFRNKGGGHFEDVTLASGTADASYGQGVVVADVEGDGDADLYLANYGTDRLLVNLQDGTFADLTREAGLGLDGWSSSAAFADADGDGDLDLYVTRYVEHDPNHEPFCANPKSGQRWYCDPSLFRGATDHLYRNRGDGTFEEATREAGLEAADGRGLGVVFVDLDGDLLPEIYVANDLTINLLFRNRGDGTFENISLISGTAVNAEGKPEGGMGLGVGDVDGDGDADIAVSNFDVETNTLYRNLGSLEFEDVSAASGFGIPSFNLVGFGLALSDLDLDGDLDVYIANGHIREKPRRQNVTYAERHLLLLGNGQGQFYEQRCHDLETVGRGLAVADYDNDGDIDIAIQENGGPSSLLRNDLNGGHWLGLRLRGLSPNAEAVGAKVVLTTTRNRQVRWVLAGDSYQSSSDRRLLFGLADGEALGLKILWPSGRRQELRSPPVDRYLIVREDGSEKGDRPQANRRARGARGSPASGTLPVAAPARPSRRPR